MVCCLLLGACDQQKLGAALLQRLQAARTLLADLVPAHIAADLEEEQVKKLAGRAATPATASAPSNIASTATTAAGSARCSFSMEGVESFLSSFPLTRRSISELAARRSRDAAAKAGRSSSGPVSAAPVPDAPASEPPRSTGAANVAGAGAPW